jgi:hypothetical protein
VLRKELEGLVIKETLFINVKIRSYSAENFKDEAEVLMYIIQNWIAKGYTRCSWHKIESNDAQ